MRSAGKRLNSSIPAIIKRFVTVKKMPEMRNRKNREKKGGGHSRKAVNKMALRKKERKKEIPRVTNETFGFNYRILFKRKKS